MTIVPFALQAGLSCSSASYLAAALALELRPVDEPLLESRLDALAEPLHAVADHGPGAQLDVLAELGRQFTAARAARSLDDLLLDRVVRRRRGHAALVVVALADAARRAGLPIEIAARGTELVLAHPGHGLPVVVDVLLPEPRELPLDEHLALRRRCGHQVAYTLLREVIDLSTLHGDLRAAVRAAELRLALPLSRELVAAAEQELRSLRARLN